MSKKQYLKALNSEIQKLNGIIDGRILQEQSYKREATRHKRLLRELKRAEMQRSLLSFMNFFKPSWF